MSDCLTKDQTALVEKYIPLAHKLSYEFSKGHPGESEDFLSIAFLGLIKAAVGYDSTKASFFTYARQRINGELLDSVRLETHFRRAYDTPVERRGRPRNVRATFTSIEEIPAQASKWPDGRESTDDTTEKAFTAACLSDAFSTLDMRTQQVLYWHYVLEKSKADIAHHLHLSEARIYQIQNAGFRKLGVLLTQDHQLD